MKWSKIKWGALGLALVMMFAICVPAMTQALTEISVDEFRQVMGMETATPNEGPPLVVLATDRPTKAPEIEGKEFTLLLVGTDNYTDNDEGRSDAMIIVRLDTKGETIKMVSFMRDLYVNIPGNGSTRLNAAYVYGGAELLEETLYDNFGVTVDAYVAVNFERMVDVIDQIGGIEIDVSAAEMKQLNNILRYYNKQYGIAQSDQLLTEAGVQTLTGKQALSFSRIRKMDSDFKRTARQRQVVEAAFHKIMQLDMGAVSNLIVANMGNVSTDINLGDALQLIPMAKKAQNATFETLRIPADDAFERENIRGMDVLVPNLNKNKQLLSEFFSGE